MKNTAATSPAAPPGEKKMKQGSVRDFFTTMKSRNENTRKRKLSENDDDIQVLKVRCGDENVDLPKDDGSLKKDNLAKAIDKKEVTQDKVDLENKEETPSDVVDVDSAEEAMEEEEAATAQAEQENESEPALLEEKSCASEDKNSEADREDKASEENASEATSSPDKSTSDLDELPCANISLATSAFNSSLLMDMDDKDSITSISDIPITPMKDTPKARKLTPKQIERQLESQKRREAKELEKAEREKKRQQEKDERQRQKEEKEKLKEQERLEKIKKRQAEIDQKNEEKKAKEEEKRKQEEKRLEEKKRKEEEKIKKKEKRVDDKISKELEKKKAEEEEKKKQEKTVAAFASFFKKTSFEQTKVADEPEVFKNNFMPFRLKKGMKLAPKNRYTLQENERSSMEESLATQAAKKLYLEMLKNKIVLPKKSTRTFPTNEKGAAADDDVVIIEDTPKNDDEEMGEIIVTSTNPESKEKLPRAKLLQFTENRRPAYWGTWSKKSDTVGARKPFGKEKLFDYELDSDEEWEEEEPGESLHGSDDDKESEDEYEVDNDLFVPHGYLSDEEAGNSEDEALPAEEQKERLRQLELEFQEELKKKVKQLTPRMVTCFNPNDPSKRDDAVHNQVLRLLEQFAAVVVTEKILTSFNSETPECDTLDDEPADLNSSVKPEGSSKKSNKMRVPVEAIPDFIRLLHGNTKNRNYLIKEFIKYWDKKLHPEIDIESEEEHGRCLISMGNANKVLRELAVWQACPDEGPLHGRLCWWVAKEVREQHNLADLPLPNAWTYLLKPAARRSKTPKAAAEKPEKSKRVPEAEPEALSPEPAPADTPPKTAKENLITKFTKVLTAEERQQQLEAEKLKAKEKKKADTAKCAMLASPFGPQSAFFVKNGPTSSTPSAKEAPVAGPSTSMAPSSSTPSAPKPSPAGEQKKGRRVSLMFSVPRGQSIPSTRPVDAPAAPSVFTPPPPAPTKKDDDDDDVVPLN